MEILFSHDKFLHGKILSRNPSSPPAPQEKTENVSLLPNNQYYL